MKAGILMVIFVVGVFLGYGASQFHEAMEERAEKIEQIADDLEELVVMVELLAEVYEAKAKAAAAAEPVICTVGGIVEIVNDDGSFTEMSLYFCSDGTEFWS